MTCPKSNHSNGFEGQVTSLNSWDISHKDQNVDLSDWIFDKMASLPERTWPHDLLQGLGLYVC